MQKISKIALMMGNNSFIGREYASNLIINNINFEILIFGKRLSNNIEKNRTKGYWKPLSQSKILKNRKFYYFDKVKSNKLLQHLKFKKYHLGIQGGGLGIINKKIIKCFKKGILNMHPGKLPNYRGSSAPELQIMDQKMIHASFHLINDKIDSGRLIYTKKLNLDYSSYEKMRSQIYPSMTKNLPSIINKILQNNFKSKNLVSYETKHLPKKFIGNKIINKLKLNWNKYTKNYATK
tara:strand:+ start:4827 stop:5534 length:708 start_codon:yes stop_codon:yes gene_type:complete